MVLSKFETGFPPERVAVSRRSKARLARFGFLAVFLGIWELLPTLGVVDPELLPPFSLVLGTLVELFLTGAIIGDLLITVFEILIGFSIGAILGVGTGLVIGTSVRAEKIINPFVNSMVAVPQSIFLPLFIFAFGTGVLEKIIFGITHAYFVIVINTVSGVQQVDRELVLTARSFGITDRQLFRHIYVRSALPMILTGLRLGMIFAVVGVIIAEMYISQSGIGKLIMVWGSSFRLPRYFAGILLISVVTIVFNEVIRRYERRVSQWRL